MSFFPFLYASLDSQFTMTAQISSSMILHKVFVQMSGAPGSGKTTTANLLASKINAHVIPHDSIKSALLDENIPFDQAARISYRMNWVLAEDAMQRGRNIIVDSICNYQTTLDEGRALAQKYGYTYRYVEIRADIDDLALLDSRLRSRVSLRAQRTSVNNRPSDAGGARHVQDDAQPLFQKWITNPSRPNDEVEMIVVDAAGNLDERLEYILKKLLADES